MELFWNVFLRVWGRIWVWTKVVKSPNLLTTAYGSRLFCTFTPEMNLGKLSRCTRVSFLFSFQQPTKWTWRPFIWCLMGMHDRSDWNWVDLTPPVLTTCWCSCCSSAVETEESTSQNTEFFPHLQQVEHSWATSWHVNEAASSWLMFDLHCAAWCMSTYCISLIRLCIS